MLFFFKLRFDALVSNYPYILISFFFLRLSVTQKALQLSFFFLLLCSVFGGTGRSFCVGFIDDYKGRV